MTNVPTFAREYYLTSTGSYENLTIRTKNVERPRHANDVLVKVHAVSLQYRDLWIASGKYDSSLAPDLVPCSDMAGEIVDIGISVKDWKVGDRVCANFAPEHIHGDTTTAAQSSHLGGSAHGVLTEYRTFPAYSLVSIPEHLSYIEASTLPCAALTAYNALMGPTPVKAGDHVLILGTGGVSIFGLQFAIASGAVVIATSSSDEKLKISSKLGAKHVINYNTTPNWDEEVLRLTHGKGVDHVIEVGGVGTIIKSMNATRLGGHVHFIGAVSKSGGPETAGTVLRTAIRRALTIRGIQVGSVSQFKDMMSLLAANPEKTRPIVDNVFAFDEAKQAYAHLTSQTHVGKIVIEVAGG